MNTRELKVALSKNESVNARKLNSEKPGGNPIH